MKQVMYGIKIVDVNDFGGWIGYEPVKQEMALGRSEGTGRISFSKMNIISVSLRRAASL